MSLAIYRLLLRLYPAEFRRRWEEELLYTFKLQLSDGWFGAWSCVLAELLPASRECLTIPAVSLASTGTLYFGLIWALGNGPAINSLYHHLIAKLGG
jgi:hypothetical protein